MPRPCFGQPAMPPASPAPAQPRGQALAQPPPGLGPAVPVELVLPRAPSLPREKPPVLPLWPMQWLHLPPTSPRDSGGGGGSHGPRPASQGSTIGTVTGDNGLRPPNVVRSKECREGADHVGQEDFLEEVGPDRALYSLDGGLCSGCGSQNGMGLKTGVGWGRV